ncbi:MAG TPA: hypothetical protein VKK79_12425 [Candidatus Lokiarchaeia archaeon]|nr:hypothetical protein [Candidatus Lokiarchaeia archaeon]
MTLSDEILRSIKETDESDLWEYAAALLSIQGAILRIEEKEQDPEAIKEIASRAVDLATELDAILGILEENLDE